MGNPTRNSDGILAGATTNDLDVSAIFEARSTTKGVLVSRGTEGERDLIPTPATGLLFWQTDNIAGLREYNGTDWVFVTGDLNSVLLKGNTAENSITLTQTGDGEIFVSPIEISMKDGVGDELIYIYADAGAGNITLRDVVTASNNNLNPTTTAGSFQNTLPAANGVLAVSVNGNTADAAGNITISAGTGTVESVTGDLVDNTDPDNPIVNTPTLQQVSDEGASTTTPISVTNGTSTANITADNIYTVNASTGQYANLLPTGLQLSTNTGSKGLLVKNDNMATSYTVQAPNFGSTGTYYAVFPDSEFGSPFQSVTTNLSGTGTTYASRYRDGMVNVTDAATINSVSEQVLSSTLVPANTFTANSLVDLDMFFTRVGTAANATIKVYVNDTNDLVTALPVFQGISTTTSLNNGFHRTFKLTGTLIEGFSGTTSANNDVMGSAGTPLSGAFVVGNAYYVIVTVSLGNGADVLTQKYIRMRANR